MMSYIVRVYRCDEKSGEITGIVEVTDPSARIAFHNFSELRAIFMSCGVKATEEQRET